jgi:hypothetical protein
VIAVFKIVSMPLAIVGFGMAASAMGFIIANGMSLVMQRHGARAGTAAGLNGFVMTLLGALAAPLPTVFFEATVPGLASFMAIVMAINATVTTFNLSRIRVE